MNLGVRGHVAIVTGAGQGIGAEIAIALAEEGCKVVAWDQDRLAAAAVAAQIKSAGGEAVAVMGEVSRPKTVDRVFKSVMKRFGAIHILVNNADFFQDAPITEMSDETWKSVLDICLTGVFLCSRAVVPTMIKQRYGRIINISGRAHFGDFYKVNYSAAKAGVNGLTRALSLELGKYDITVNAVAPGFICSERAKAMRSDKRIEKDAMAWTPIKRPGTPRDIAGGVLYLASQRAGFVTGEVLHITGGRYFSS